MKIGDKVYCKPFYESFNPYGFFNSGFDYNIIDMDKYQIIIFNDKCTYNFFSDLVCEENIFNRVEFNKYFYTERELRKLKLEKISNDNCLYKEA